jgi:hypothetical protein
MTIRFTVADDQLEPRKCAILSARQLAAFRSFAATATVRSGNPVIDGEGQGFAAYDFEARVCPFALATLAAIFDHDVTAIEILEDAQYRGRLIRIARDDQEGDIHMWVSSTPDKALEMTLANRNAYALLAALGVSPEPIGEIRSRDLRARLRDPEIRGRFTARDLDHYIPQLNSLAWLGGENSNARVVWA